MKTNALPPFVGEHFFFLVGVAKRLFLPHGLCVFHRMGHAGVWRTQLMCRSNAKCYEVN